MFQTSRRAFALLVAWVAASAALAAAPAHAVQTKNVTYQCKLPVLGVDPWSVTIEIDAPDAWNQGEPTPAFDLSLLASVGGEFSRGLGLFENAAAIEGTATVDSRVTLPEGGALSVRLPLAIARTPVGSPSPDPFVLRGAGSTPMLTFDEPGRANFTVEALRFNLKLTDADGQAFILPPLTATIDGERVTDSDGDPETFDVYCKLDPGQASEFGGPVFATLELLLCSPGCGGGCGASWSPPSTPVEAPVQDGDVTLNSILVRWSPATDDFGWVSEYRVVFDDGEARVPGSASSYLLSGLGSDSDYFVEVYAIDPCGNESEPLQLLYTTLSAPPVGPPTNLRVTPGTTEAELCWTAATGSVVSYRVFKDLAKIADTSDTCTTVTGLAADQVYSFAVQAVGEGGTASVRVEVVVRTRPSTPPPPVRYGYALKGSTSVKTLSKGTLPLTGGIDAALTVATGAFSADLTLNDTQGRLTALGFLPVTAKIGFVPSGKTTGTLLEGVLKTKSFVRIKVKEVKLFGAIPLAGGNNCQTKSLSEINLQSTDPEFKPLQGGPIAGTYRISDLNGCGVLNGLVSPLTAGAGNTINLTLTPKVTG